MVTISVLIQAFSDWINSHSLVDLPLGGARFTWSNHQDTPILSHLERFLVSGDWIDLFPEVSQVAFPKPVSDHCPIIIDSNCERWGPVPFRFELMWLEEPYFCLIIKLKKFKEKIKEWVKENFAEATVAKASILEKYR